MPITNKIISGIDLPVYEFLRPSLFTNSPNSAGLFSIPGGKNRFMFWYETSTPGPIRYDTLSDMSMRLPYIPRGVNNLTSLAYSTKGYCGQVISASVSSIDIAAYDGNQTLIGKIIRITKGPGKNQERTIVGVSAPITVDRMALTAVTNNQGTNAGTVIYTDTLKAIS